MSCPHSIRLAFLITMTLGIVTNSLAAEPPAILLNQPLVFHDNFETGDPATRWEAASPQGWKLVEQNGNKVWSQFQHIVVKTPVRSPFNRSVANGVVVGSCVLDVKLQSTARDYPHRSLCLFFGYQDPAHLYYVHFGQKTDDHANQIFIVNNADRKKISTKTTDGTKWDNGWHHARVVRDVESGKIDIYFDNMQEPVMTAVDKTFTWGQVGIGSFDDTGNFDDVLVYGKKVEPPAGSGTKNTAAASVLAPGAKPEMLSETGAGEGPAWNPELGLLTSGDGHIFRRDRSGKTSIHRANAGSNGLLFDKDGRLIIAEPVKRRVTRLDKDGNLTVLTDSYLGKKYNQPNDLTVDSRGRIYFSDPRYGDRSDMQLLDDNGRPIEGVYRIDPDGKVTRIIAHEVDRPNGLVITPDDQFLYVADNNNDTVGGARKLWRFNLKNDGTVDHASRKLIHDWKGTRGPDGMKLDSQGRLFVAGGLNRQNPPAETQDKPTAGIYVFSPAGELSEFIPIPRDETTNCAFGDDDLKTLYVTAGGSLWSIRVATPGKPVFPTLAK